MASIEKNIAAIHQRMATTAAACGRNVADIQLLAVSKTRPASDIRAAIACGQRDFGENYLQEALPKIEALADETIRWHYIGPIQANKTRAIANSFDWVHSVDRIKTARRLGQQRDPGKPPLNICLQVNISGEASKSGFATADIGAAAAEIATLEGLVLRGLMGIPRPSPEVFEQRRQFVQLRQLLESLQQQLPELDTLSMGMSADMEAAILEGANWLRIGTAIFGPRPARP
jgi:pyridoxal phosphate enzyme (YggS family)